MNRIMFGIFKINSQRGVHCNFVHLYIMYDIRDVADWIFKICRKLGEQFGSPLCSGKLHRTAKNYNNKFEQIKFVKMYLLLIITEGVEIMFNCFPHEKYTTILLLSVWTRDWILSEILAYRVTSLPFSLCDTVLESRWRDGQQRSREERWVQLQKQSPSHPTPVYSGVNVESSWLSPPAVMSSYHYLHSYAAMQPPQSHPTCLYLALNDSVSCEYWVLTEPQQLHKSTPVLLISR